MKFPNWPNQKGCRNIELGLSRVNEILQRLDNPHKKLPPTIHIAGTNGKGSTLSFLRAILEENNQKVHCYTSPHLVQFNERIILAGQEISDEFLNECLEFCKEACEISPEIEPTYFEGITIAAFLAFSKIKADFLILETGLGGRLDATNVIEENLFSIITPISFDHTEFLGNSLEKIAFEKAGIIKKNCPVFVAKQENQVLEVIKNQAQKLNSEIKIFGHDFDIEINQENWQLTEFGDNLSLKTPKKIALPFPQFMAGLHQIENAAIASHSIISQNFDFVKKNRIKSAILKTKWRARLENIDSGKIYNKINEIFSKKNRNFEIILDGSHNFAGSKTISEFLKTKKTLKIAVFAMLKDKDCKNFLINLKNDIDFLIAMPILDEKNSLKTSEIFEIANEIGIKTFQAQNFDESFEILNSICEKNSTIIFCGSLYFAGNFLEQNN